MKIGVCFKIVPDYEDVLPEEWQDSACLDFSFVKKIYGCFDEAALEMALQIVDDFKAANGAAGWVDEGAANDLPTSDASAPETFDMVETVAVTCGAPEGAVSEGLLRALFAAGFSDVVLLPPCDAFSPPSTADMLAAYFMENPADLILSGRMTGPGDSGMVPFYLAKALGLPLLTELTFARYDDEAKKLEITRKGSQTLQTCRLTKPVVATVGDAEAAYLRLFPLKARMEAKKREFTRWIPGMRPEENLDPQAVMHDTSNILQEDAGKDVLLCSAPEENTICKFFATETAQKMARALLEIIEGLDRPEHNIAEPIDQEDAASCEGAAEALAGNVLPENIVLFRESLQEKDLGMRFAAEKGMPCHTDVVDFREENGTVYAVRRVYSTHMEGMFPAAGSVCILAPSAEKKWSVSEADAKSDADFFLDSSTCAELIREIPLEQTEDLTSARLVLLGGKGLGKKENFRRLEALAEKLGAACGCTRPVAMAGWASYDKVVGLSGATLQADVCIAFGVSGAAPLMQGASGASRLIAINNDPKTPIFGRCSDGVIADCLEILEAMEMLTDSCKSMESGNMSL